ncbi:hypothetical protein EGP95_07105 [bacterium]|nr:hypothetical protein [bacterium]
MALDMRGSKKSLDSNPSKNNVDIDLQWIKDNEVFEKSRINKAQYDTSSYDSMITELDKSNNSLSRQDIRKMEEELLAVIHDASNNNAISFANERLIELKNKYGDFFDHMTPPVSSLSYGQQNIDLNTREIAGIIGHSNFEDGRYLTQLISDDLLDSFAIFFNAKNVDKEIKDDVASKLSEENRKNILLHLLKLFNKENSWYKPKHNNIPFNEGSFLDGVGSILLGSSKIQNKYDIATLITFMDSCEYFKMDNLPELVVYYKRLLSQPNYLEAYDKFFNELDQDMINNITSNQTKHSFEINADIKNFVLKDMPSDLTKLEKAIYIYSKLCKILDYDMEYYNDNANKKFIAEESISDVDLSNNNVVCYTFSYIYSGLLREIGIDQIKEAKINKGEFVNKHASVEFVVDNIVIMADSTLAGAEIGDLTTLKVENKINGLRCSQFNIEKQNKVNQAKKKVEMILEKEKTDEETNYFLPSQERLDSMTSIDKYILFNDLVAATPLTGVSLLGYIQVLKDRLNLYIITKVEKDLDQNDLIINIKMKPLGVEKTYFENAAISYKINARNKEIIYNGSNFVNRLSNNSVPSSGR